MPAPHPLLAGRRPPTQPGCYLFATANGTIIYVGKAKTLASRLASYLTGTPTGKTAALLEEAASLDWIVVPTETDALLLEASLIRKHQPRYNIRLRDSSSYPYLVVTGEHPQRLVYRRNPGGPTDRTFGPFPDPKAARATRDLLLELFPIRSCTPTTYRQHQRLGRPCLLADIGRCSAPCVQRVDDATHRQLATELVAFLEGRRPAVLNQLAERMQTAAAAHQFEHAATLRDRLHSAQAILDQQTVVDGIGSLDADVVATCEDPDAAQAAVCRLEVRNGRVVGTATWPVDTAAQPLSRRTILTQLYERHTPPPLVLVDGDDGLEPLASALSTSRNVTFSVPQRGGRRQLLALAATNAAETLQQQSLRRAADPAARADLASTLADQLDLPAPPLRIEATDISHLAGTGVVGSLVVAVDAQLRKSEYRQFKLTVDRNDDVRAMYEVVSRRLERYLTACEQPIGERDSFGRLPDLLVIDGGHPQLAAAVTAADNVGVDVPVVALAKREELVCLPDGREIQLGAGPARWLLQQLRDEAHRFALTYQRRTRQATLASALSHIDGVGPRRQAALAQQFPTLEQLAAAETSQVAAVPGIGKALAARITSAAAAQLHQAAADEPDDG